MNNGGVGSGGDGGRQLQATPTVFFFIASVFIAFLLAPRPCSAQTSPVLDPKEVTALQQIARTLGKTDWNFSVDPCSWFPPAASDPSVGCECPQNSTTYCHVISILHASNSQSIYTQISPTTGSGWNTSKGTNRAPLPYSVVSLSLPF
ncbi:hypothetical protein EJ110_NYTH06850 [Nymphaea thermarum]|nr:hypothetical protein EJ110_NYTH06850 [Nymphaea thermarum]